MEQCHSEYQFDWPTLYELRVRRAANNGAWLYSASQARDFDGEYRLAGNLSPDIGADEFDGYQLTNDIAVLSIPLPGGYSQTSDTTFVTAENPLAIAGLVKNLSS